jgi:starvation-inducible DNA-binding protein
MQEIWNKIGVIMRNLEEALKVATASVFHFGLMVHTAHFNVTGPRFYELHLLFERIYKDVEDSFDDFGEQIRALDIFAPLGLSEYLSLSALEDQAALPAQEMIHALLIENDKVLMTLNEVSQLAQKHIGLQNFIQGRAEAHEKHGWMLRATL